MKVDEFLQKEDKEEFVKAIAKQLEETSQRKCIGLGWEYDPIEDDVTITIRLRHVYLSFLEIKRLIEAIDKVCEEFSFNKETTYIMFEYSKSNVIGYVDISFEIRGEEDEG